MKLLSSAVLLFVVLAVVACAPTAEEAAVEEPDTTDADIEAIHGLREAWVAADNDSDLDGVIAVFTDDVVLMVAEEPILIGKEAVRSWYFVGPEIEMSSDEVVVAGDWAFDRGTFITSNGPGRYVGILQRQTDGSWKYARVMVMNLDDPPPEQ
jgi:ketosteroid isomerase-like protein